MSDDRGWSGVTILVSVTTITVSQTHENGESNIGIPDRITTRPKLRNDYLHPINVCLTPRIRISHASRSELLTKPLCLKLDFEIMLLSQDTPRVKSELGICYVIMWSCWSGLHHRCISERAQLLFAFHSGVLWGFKDGHIPATHTNEDNSISLAQVL